MPLAENKFGRRRTVNISEDVAIELNRIANSQGKTLFSLMNEIGQSQIEAVNHGFSLSEAVEGKKLVERAKKSRMILVNQDIMYYASSEAVRNEPNKFLKMVYRNATWYGSGFIDASEENFIDSLRKFVEAYFWDCTEATFERKGEDHLELKLAFVPEMPVDHTKVLMKVFEAIFNANQYFVVDSTVRGGFIRSLFRKIPSPGPIETNR